MTVTISQIVERVRSGLNQSNRDSLATFNGWVLDEGGRIVGVKLTDVDAGAKLTNARVELGPELVYVKTYNPNTGDTVCPVWFRQLEGSPANDSYLEGSVAVINPRWSYWSILQAVLSGIDSVYPDLFAVKSVTLTSTPIEEKYLLPADCETILDIKLLYPGPGNHKRPIKTSSVDVHSADGNRYLYIHSITMGGLSIELTYKAAPVKPSLTSGEALFTDTGLPESCADLPELYAKATLIPSTDSSRTQTKSIEQSERAKYVQAGSGSAVARMWMQMYETRLKQEKRKLDNLYPPRVFHRLNG